MKNITAFAVLVIIFKTISFCPSLGAQDLNGPGRTTENKNPYVFSISPQFGLLYGKAIEIVFPTNTKGIWLSQLLWNMKPLLYYGAAAELSLFDPMKHWSFFSGFSAKIGIPGISGVMEDRDWQSVENDQLTDFSTHDNYTREAFLLDFTAGVSFPLGSLLLLKAYAAVSYTSFRWTGMDGWGQYAVKTAPGKYRPMDDAPVFHQYSGKVIHYNQDWLMFSPGVSLDLVLFNTFSCSLSFLISPLVFGADLDEHLGSNVQYREYFQFGLFLEPGGRISWSPNEWLALSAQVSYRYINTVSYQTYMRNIGGAEYHQTYGKAGGGVSLMDAGLFVKIRLQGR
jgi:outer membrane protease